MSAFDGTVESVHPFVLKPDADGLGEYTRTPDDYEDIDALPVEEQAAIVCAIFASDPCNRYEWVDVVECRKAHGRWYPTGEDAQIACDCLVITAHPWAEAEARIRNGEVPRG